MIILKIYLEEPHLTMYCVIASNPEYYGYQCQLASIVYIFFDKKAAGASVISNQQLAEANY